MLRRLGSSLKTSTLRSCNSTTVGVRRFSDMFQKERDGLETIPDDAEMQGGRRKEELDMAARGEIRFNRDPIVPPHDQGTKANPILVPSFEARRAVGFEEPNSGQLEWFNLDRGYLYFVPHINLYFKLVKPTK